MTTRDSLAEEYAKTVDSWAHPEHRGILSTEANCGFKSGWDALAKLIREEISLADHHDALLDQIEKLMGRRT